MSRPYHVALEMDGQVVYHAAHESYDNDFWIDGMTVGQVLAEGDSITDEEWGLLYCSALINLCRAMGA